MVLKIVLIVVTFHGIGGEIKIISSLHVVLLNEQTGLARLCVNGTKLLIIFAQWLMFFLLFCMFQIAADMFRRGCIGGRTQQISKVKIPDVTFILTSIVAYLLNKSKLY